MKKKYVSSFSTFLCGLFWANCLLQAPCKANIICDLGCNIGTCIVKEVQTYCLNNCNRNNPLIKSCLSVTSVPIGKVTTMVVVPLGGAAGSVAGMVTGAIVGGAAGTVALPGGGTIGGSAIGATVGGTVGGVAGTLLSSAALNIVTSLFCLVLCTENTCNKDPKAAALCSAVCYDKKKVIAGCLKNYPQFR